ncbi:ABC transporter ATP-binding protein [Megasphaera sp.]|uniref:ABC transporter ATP-binding protein n=1 Tax=Megasphaera sp. TaxID=2023260 RepID=UPI0027BA649E|nr:oligopeptide/dipeptide ABC transporter ATP-binding protein [Megasphaera sp.]
MTLIEAKGLTKQFVIDRSWLGRPKKVLTAVNRVSLTIEPGETVGLVGESGCGKSTFARTLLGLYPKTDGDIFYKGRNIGEPEIGKDYRRQVQMIFQDPYASLDPRMTVEDIISEPLRNYGLCSDDRERRQRVADLLTQVDLRPETAQRYPHEFSGGQRQRIGIARALAVDPECIFCDEPISALDVSVQVQIVNMLKRLQEERQLSYLFIAHDLSMVHHLSRRIGVMYLGNLVELGPSDAVFHGPLHPYTQMLIASVPRPDPHYQRTAVVSGEVPSPLDVPSGCVFHPRCPYCDERCRNEAPALRPVREGRLVACHHVKGGTD